MGRGNTKWGGGAETHEGGRGRGGQTASESRLDEIPSFCPPPPDVFEFDVA